MDEATNGTASVTPSGVISMLVGAARVAAVGHTLLVRATIARAEAARKSYAGPIHNFIIRTTLGLQVECGPASELIAPRRELRCLCIDLATTGGPAGGPCATAVRLTSTQYRRAHS